MLYYKTKFHTEILYTSGFAATHVVVSVRHPYPILINLPTPYQPRKYTLKIHTGDNEIDR